MLVADIGDCSVLGSAVPSATRAANKLGARGTCVAKLHF